MSNKEIVYWKQSGGNLVSIDDMDINHLRNVLKMIVKNSNKRKAKSEIANNGLGKNFNDDESKGNQW
jgi:hypothetical protein